MNDYQFLMRVSEKKKSAGNAGDGHMAKNSDGLAIMQKSSSKGKRSFAKRGACSGI
jgi:hypothetical protein